VSEGHRVRQIAALTGVRGIAALWVATYHGTGSLISNLRLPTLLENLVQSGWLAVDLFFVLSGFVISLAHMGDFTTGSGEKVWRFLKLRLARIYPAHLVAALLWLPLIGAGWLRHHSLSGGFTRSFNLRTLGHALTLTNGWGLPASQGWNLPSWSVGSEWFAYLTFPLIAIGLRHIHSILGMLVVAGATMAASTSLAFIANNGHQYMLPESFTLVRVVSEFLIGCCAYGIYARMPAGTAASWISWTGTLGCVVLACWGRHGLADGLFILTFFLIVLGLSKAPNPVGRLLGLPPFVHLGKISYSIYLVHALIIVTLRNLKPIVDLPPLVIGTIYFALVIGAAHVLYATVEEPARTYLRRVWVDSPHEGAFTAK
jgi:peptidoglycan/LPS O-acetylase OafA/YrhL